MIFFRFVRFESKGVYLANLPSGALQASFGVQIRSKIIYFPHYAQPIRPPNEPGLHPDRGCCDSRQNPFSYGQSQALQYIYTHPQWNEKIFELLSKRITAGKLEIPGWRKGKHWKRILIRKAGRAYLKKAGALQKKVLEVLMSAHPESLAEVATVEQLSYYHQMLTQHMELMERRLIKGKTIPHVEKVFSIFLPRTELVKKGKRNPSVEFGKNLTITSDQHHLIVDWQIAGRQTDNQLTVPIARRVSSTYTVQSLSVDIRYGRQGPDRTVDHAGHHAQKKAGATRSKTPSSLPRSSNGSKTITMQWNPTSMSWNTGDWIDVRIAHVQASTAISALPLPPITCIKLAGSYLPVAGRPSKPKPGRLGPTDQRPTVWLKKVNP